MSCGALLDPNAKFCGQCGSKSPSTRPLPRLSETESQEVEISKQDDEEYMEYEASEVGSEAGDDVAAICTLTSADTTVGDHVCPNLGKDRVQYFDRENKIFKLLEASGEDLGRSFSLDAKSISATKDGSSGGFCCAVSDPNAADCPLVYISNGFEDLTGYTRDFATGRSCRFLQPTSKLLNDAVNLEERKIMREFCNTVQPLGTTIINLLMNERFTGERFWNLLRMQYMMVDGDVYIFAVQTNLDAYMPKIFKKKFKSAEKNRDVVSKMGGFFDQLHKMREQLRKMVDAPIMELKGYFTFQMNFTQVAETMAKPIALPDDSEQKEKKSVIKAGVKVQAAKTIRYASSVVSVKSKGRVVSMDAFGNAVIEWEELGIIDILKRDLKFLRVKVDSGSSAPADGLHPGWKAFFNVLNDPAGSENAEGIAGSFTPGAREEIARKLIMNHTAVINDVTNPSMIKNIESKPLTQTHLSRVPVGSKPFVDQMLREVARRLLGRRSGMASYAEKVDTNNDVQREAWIGTAIYLAARTQTKADQKPGRKPDMSEAAGDAFLAVMEEVASSCFANKDEVPEFRNNMALSRANFDGHPSWHHFKQAIEEPSGGQIADGVAAMHKQGARDEIARKIIENHNNLIKDICNPSTTQNIDGKPLTQTELTRVDAQYRPYIDMMLRETTRRLLGQRNAMENFYEIPDLENPEQEQAWRGAVNYLKGRIQCFPDQKPGRTPDMSPEAMAALIAVMEELASEADGMHPSWEKFKEALDDPLGSQLADGIAASHSPKAREEIARKLISNHRAVLCDVCNPSKTRNIIGKPLTQVELERVHASMRPNIDQLFRETVRRLLGRRGGLHSEEHVVAPQINNQKQAQAWRACVNYLGGGRVQSKSQQKPGRKPDMSPAAYAAFIAVMEEIAAEADGQHPTWMAFRESVSKTGGEEAEGVAAKHDKKARDEIAKKLITNHKQLLADVCNPSPIENIIGKPLTQTELKRVHVSNRVHIEAMFRETCRRLLGNRPGLEDYKEKIDPKDRIKGASWRVCATYLATRVQKKPEEKPGRKPDMSQAAQAAFQAVMDELVSEMTK